MAIFMQPKIFDTESRRKNSGFAFSGYGETRCLIREIMKILSFSLTVIFMTASVAFGQTRDAAPVSRTNGTGQIKVLELRNYLLKPGTVENFRKLFNDRFVEPMNALGGYTVGQFRLNNDADRFVWMRGYADMKSRFDFLNAFYLNHPVWKKYRGDANSMIVNSDNVYLLRPLEINHLTVGDAERQFENKRAVVVVDFYICNSTLDQTIALFKTDYIPFLKSLPVDDVTFWTSETAENDFPRLPVFQDKNLLVSITVFKNEREAESKLKRIDSPAAKLDNSLKELITVRNRLILYPSK